MPSRAGENEHDIPWEEFPGCPYPTGSGERSGAWRHGERAGEFLLVYAPSGSVTVECAEGCRELPAAHLLLLAPDHRCRLKPGEGTRCRYLLLRNGEAFAHLVGQPCRFGRGSRGAGRFSRLVQQMEQPGGMSPFEASARTYAILMELWEQLHQGETGERTHSPLVRQALEGMDTHPERYSGVEDLAEELGVSASHLIRTFHGETGISPGKYLRSARLERAKLLLRYREYSVEMVALMAGFSGSNYFCRVFRQDTGESPSAWRQRHFSEKAPTSEERRRLKALEDLYHL